MIVKMCGRMDHVEERYVDGRLLTHNDPVLEFGAENTWDAIDPRTPPTGTEGVSGAGTEAVSGASWGSVVNTDTEGTRLMRALAQHQVQRQRAPLMQ